MKKTAMGCAVCTLLAGIFYSTNSGDFGKTVIACWGLAAVALAVLMVWASFAGGKFLKICGGLLAVMQPLPLFCWLTVGTNGFDVCHLFPFGPVFLPCWVAVAAHVLLLLWSGMIFVKARGR